jgi:hypothetical protein
MFCIDEVGGIPLAVTATAEAALASGIESKLLMGGNPTHTEGPLYMACTAHAHLWEIVQITGDPDDPKRSNRMDIKWARQQIEMYGREHPWVKVNVFGEFPPSSINALLGPDDVEDAKRRYGELKFSTTSRGRRSVWVSTSRAAYRAIAPSSSRGRGLMTLPCRRDARQELERDRSSSNAGQGITGRVSDRSEILTFVDDTGGWGHGTLSTTS